jgi:ADP-ribose pyrophosphatase YjhB (NUDIX family)
VSTTAPITERSSIKAPRIGSAAVVVDGDHVLLGVRAKPPMAGYWVLPGGGVQPFETLSAAAEREVLEETGLVVNVAEQLGVWEIVEPPNEHRLVVYHRATVAGGELTAADDLSRARFWSRDELEGLRLTPLVSEVLTTLGWLAGSPADRIRAHRAG